MTRFLRTRKNHVYELSSSSLAQNHLLPSLRVVSSAAGKRRHLTLALCHLEVLPPRLCRGLCGQLQLELAVPVAVVQQDARNLQRKKGISIEVSTADFS